MGSNPEKKAPYDNLRETMDLFQYLITNSNKDHKISKAELMSEIYHCRFPEADRKTYQPNTYDDSIRNKVDSIIKNFSGETVFDFLTLMEEDDENFSGPEISKKKYYTEGPLSEQTVSILRDAIAVYPYAEPKITQKIIRELNKLTSKYNLSSYYKPEIEAKKYPGTYYKNLTEIYKALSTSVPEPEGSRLEKADYNTDYLKYENKLLRSKSRSKLQFEYCSYQYDAQSNSLVLIPRVMKNNRTVREANPLMLLWSNGYYYLVIYYYDKKSGKCLYQNLRVDRMRNVVCTDKPAEEYTDKQYNEREGFDGHFSPRKYISRNPVMFFESRQLPEVRIKCDTTHINNAIDTFGFELFVEKYTSDEIVFSVKNVSSSGILMWALEYCDHCEILSPQPLREQMRTYAKSIIEKYSPSENDR